MNSSNGVGTHNLKDYEVFLLSILLNYLKFLYSKLKYGSMSPHNVRLSICKSLKYFEALERFGALSHCFSRLSIISSFLQEALNLGHALESSEKLRKVHSNSIN